MTIYILYFIPNMGQQFTMGAKVLHKLWGSTGELNLHDWKLTDHPKFGRGPRMTGK